jgi:hypothetical protein
MPRVLPNEESILPPQAAALAEIDLATLMRPRHHIDSALGEAGRGKVVAESPVAQEDVPAIQAVPEFVEQAQVVVVETAPDHVQDGSADQREEGYEPHHREAAPGLLP